MIRPRLTVLTGGAPSPAGEHAGDGVRAAPPPGTPGSRAAATVALAAALCAIAFVTRGGVDETVASGANTWTEIALLVVGAVAVGAGIVLAPAGQGRHGWVTAALMALMFALVAASVAWSVAPDSSWLAAGQMLAYLAVFAGAILVARPLRRGWSVLLGGLALWAVALCAWSLLAKVFPATLAASNTIGRLQAPFGYWNAIALCAAMGVPPLLWLAARRDGGRRLAGLTAPGLTLLIAVLVLSYSRSADLAAVVAVVVWLIGVPLRLRALAMLAVGAAGAAVVSAWALTHRGITGNGLSIAAQDHAGHTFGIVILIVLVLVTVVGVAVSQTIDVVALAPPTRRRVGASLIGVVAVVVIAGIVALAASPRGLTGEISHRFDELVNPQATVSATSASRVLQFGSSRPLYWHQALYVGDHHPLKGVGELGYSVGRLLDPTSVDPVFQAHSYVFETYADLGIIGLLVTAALLGAWLLASGRTLFGVRRAADAGRAELPALFTLASLVLAFGVQGTLDWTWYFSGLTVPALLAAGWLAGRGPGSDSEVAGDTPRVSPLDRPARLMVVPLLAAVVLLGGWMMWRPLHSAQLVNQATNTGAFATARAAQSADPLAIAPYQLLSALDLSAHDPAGAERALTRATHAQPDNPQAWAALAQLLIAQRQWRAAVPALHQVQELDRAPNQMTQINDGLITEAFRHIPAG